MLYLIGLGLSKGDISAKALEIAKKCDVAYIERYTGRISDDDVNELSESIGKKFKILKRPSFEDNVAELIAEAAEKNVGVFIEGDPLIATTHKILFIEAKTHGVEIKVVHSVSILTAAMGESMLDFYRFGAVCTIADWSEHYKPVSFYETIERNLGMNLHSILFLDFDESEQASPDLRRVSGIFKAAEKQYGRGILNEEREIIILHNVELDTQKNLLAKIGELDDIELGRGPTLIVIPAKLSDIEKELVDAVYRQE
ncbi:diphthine synthase [Candidatus Marsarchaeota archaeon]|nr:diphthine synthase [Candidatus Marsarchaeota archaeon]